MRRVTRIPLRTLRRTPSQRRRKIPRPLRRSLRNIQVTRAHIIHPQTLSITRKTRALHHAPPSIFSRRSAQVARIHDRQDRGVHLGCIQTDSIRRPIQLRDSHDDVDIFSGVRILARGVLNHAARVTGFGECLGTVQSKEFSSDDSLIPGERHLTGRRIR